MKKEDQATATDEIIVTPEMAESGAWELIGYDPERYSCEEVAVEIYRAMEVVRLHSAASIK